MGFCTHIHSGTEAHTLNQSINQSTKEEDVKLGGGMFRDRYGWNWKVKGGVDLITFHCIYA